MKKYRKIHLPLLNSKGDIVEQAIVDQVIEEYRVVDAGGSLDAETMARIKSRGQLIDCVRTLKAMVVRPKNSSQGICLGEMREIRYFMDKLDMVDIGDHLCLDPVDYKKLLARVDGVRIAEYNKGFHLFLESLHSAPLVYDEPVDDNPE